MLHYLQRRARHDHALSIILLHGFGANAADLTPLAELFDPQQHYHWLFPEAHLALGEDMPEARLWFPEDRQLQQQALEGYYFNTIATIDPSGLSEAAQQVVELIQSLHLSIEQSILGGFSQGSIVAIEMVANQLAAPRALLLFSSVLTAPQRWEGGLQKAKGCPFLQCHGRFDEVLRHQDAVALHQLLLNTGFQGKLESFEGGHEIPPTLTNSVVGFLLQLSQSPQNHE